MRRRLPVVVVILAVLAALVAPLGGEAGAQSSVERLRQQRRAVQQKRAKQASQINVLQADGQEIGRALDALEENLAATEADLAAARQRSAAQAKRAAEAAAAQAATQVELAQLRATVRELAIAEYMRGGKAELFPEDGDLASPMDAARRDSLLSAAVGNSSDVANRLRAAEEDFAVERAAAEKATEEARAQERRVEARVAELTEATREQEQLAVQVEDRLERALSEVDSLAQLDSALASKIASEQAAIARRLRTTRRSGTPGRSSISIGRIGNVSLSTVGGITVSSTIAGQLSRLLSAAAADGITLGGGGFRDSAAQIATRRRNCGSSEYAIWQMPASSCSPPTARPGRSMHERGLAVDFTSGGRILTRSSPAFRWLKANAGTYGFKNLPSEPWHWSTNGD